MLSFLKSWLSGPKRVQTNARVELYSWATCPYCWKAKRLLKRKGVAFEEHKIDGDDQARAAMIERTGGPKSVPQIFIEDAHVGGCDDLHALERSGELDRLLGA